MEPTRQPTSKQANKHSWAAGQCIRHAFRDAGVPATLPPPPLHVPSLAAGLRPRNLDVKVLLSIFDMLQQHYPERLDR